MLKLPMDFFDHITAGVLTKHMQQTNQIREFLTGNLFLTLLDSTALLIFLPILYFYSASLTGIVLLFSLMLAINIGVLLGPYRRRLEALYNAEGERQAMLVETIHGIQTVKALSMEPVQRKAWDQSSAQAVAMNFQGWKNFNHRDNDFQVAGETPDRDYRLFWSHAGIWETPVRR